MNKSSKKWLVTGASGLLGHSLCAHLANNSYTVVGIVRDHDVGVPNVETITCDLLDADHVSRLIEGIKPDVIVHAAGLTNVDECERNPELAQKIHVDATRTVAGAADKAGAKLIYISTDHLSDGKTALVSEEVPAYPINMYAKTKYGGEGSVLEINPDNLAVRTNFFGPGRPWRKSFSDWILDSLRSGDILNMFTDVFFTPLSLGHLCDKICALNETEAFGIFNVASRDRVSKWQFSVMLAEAAGLSVDNIRKASLSSFRMRAPRPSDMSLSTEKISDLMGEPMPSVEETINALFEASSSVPRVS